MDSLGEIPPLSEDDWELGIWRWKLPAVRLATLGTDFIFFSDLLERGTGKCSWLIFRLSLP